MIIGLTISEFGVWVGTTVPRIETLMLWELGRSKYRSWAKHYTLCSLHSHILTVYCLEGRCAILYAHSQLLWILVIHLIQGPQTAPSPQLARNGPHIWRWVAGKQAKLHLYLQPLPITHFSLVHGKIVFHKTRPWSQKGWGLLI